MPDKALHVFAAALANFHICFSFQIEKIISIIPACLGFHDALYQLQILKEVLPLNKIFCTICNFFPALMTVIFPLVLFSHGK